MLLRGIGLSKDKILIQELDCVPATVVYCRDDKSRLKYLKKNHSWTSKKDRKRNSNGITHVMFENGYITLIIGVVFKDDIYQEKGLIVHELSHCVTEVMKHTGINDDEFRSYLLQNLYIKIMSFVDNGFDVI